MTAVDVILVIEKNFSLSHC